MYLYDCIFVIIHIRFLHTIYMLYIQLVHVNLSNSILSGEHTLSTQPTGEVTRRWMPSPLHETTVVWWLSRRQCFEARVVSKSPEAELGKPL